MAVQARVDNTNFTFVLYGTPLIEKDAVLEQDAGRSIPLANHTVMAKVASTQKWVPITSLTETTGESIPLGIFDGDAVLAATLVAGDVSDASIIVGHNITVDVDQLVLENSLALDDVINATGGADNIFVQTIQDYLANIGIYPEATVAVSGFENT